MLNRDSIVDVIIDRYNRLVNVGIYMSDGMMSPIDSDLVNADSITFFMDRKRNILLKTVTGDVVADITCDKYINFQCIINSKERIDICIPIEFLNEEKFKSMVMDKAERLSKSKAIGEYLVCRCQNGVGGGAKDVIFSDNDYDVCVKMAESEKKPHNKMQVVKHATMEIILEI